MVKEYFEAAERLSNLAEEFVAEDEVANILRAGAARIAKMAHGGIIKTASEDSKPQAVDD